MKSAKILPALLGLAALFAATGARAANSNEMPSTLEAVPGGQQVLGSPAGVPFQGFLADGAGNPLGIPFPVIVNVTFRIWDAPAGGTLLHSEVQAVTVDEGVFEANLGPPTEVFNGLPRYLGLSVNAGPELTPRTEILSTPYARVSRTLSGFGEVDGQLREGGGFTELVNSTANQTMRRYFLTPVADSDWSGRSGRVIVVLGGQGHPGLGIATVQHNGLTVATYTEPAVGSRPWTFICEIPSLSNGDTIDVLVRAAAAGNPAAVRSITLETASVEEAGPPVVAFHAYNSSTDSGLPSGWNIAEGDMEVFDTGGNYSPVTDLFTAPVDGIYFFQHMVSVSGAADGARYASQFWINGSQPSAPYTDSGYTNTSGSFQGFGGSATLELSAGDTVQSNCFVSGTHDHVGTALYTWFSGQMLTSTTTPATRPLPQAAPDPDDPTR